MDCVFCGIVAGERPASFVHRGERVIAFADLHPVNPGHLLVVPRVHAAGLADLPEEDGAGMFAAARALAGALRASGLRCEGVDLLLADGEAAGQEVPHVHLHVIPRFRGDGFGFRFPAGYGAAATRADLDRAAAAVSAAVARDRGAPARRRGGR